MEPRSILIIQTAFIGDVILATALIESLHTKFPDCKIDFVVRKGNETLLEGHPLLRSIIVFDKKKKFANLARLIRRIRGLQYDYVINAQRFFTTGVMTVTSRARVTVGFDKNPLAFLFSRRVTHLLDGRHEVERNHKLIEFLVGTMSSKPRLYPSAAQLEKVRQHKDRPFITISPASVWFTKQFPREKWLEFLNVVPAGLNIFLLGGHQDQELCKSLITGSGLMNIRSLAGELTLLESAALMKDARMNFVNDSAPMHLASAMNAPVAAIFCSTVPSFGFGPLSDKSEIIQSSETLSCRPCGLHGFRACPKGHFKCAMTIQKEQLMRVLGS